MIRTIIVCGLLLSMISCLDEQRAEPAKPATFVRYINGGNRDEAKALRKTPDGGYIILANTTSPQNGTEVERIKLAKVDQFGTVEWTRIYPGTPADTIVAYRGNGIHVLDGGYIITGEMIQESGKSTLLVLQTTSNGDTPTLSSVILPRTLDADGVQQGNVHGQAVASINNSRLIVLGSLTGRPEVMTLAELNIANNPPTVAWNWLYPGNTSTLINKIFIDADNIIFGGTVTQLGSDNHTDVRLVRAINDQQGTTYDLPFGNPDLSEQANGMCQTTNGYALIGTTNTGTELNILFTRLSKFGDVLSSVTIEATYEKSGAVVDGADEVGNDICSADDGGFIILATITTTTAPDGESIGRGDTDYYLIKINTFGDEVEWAKPFGSKRIDRGVAVAQADDGGYVILGTTELANVPTIALIKTNSRGEIE